MPTAPTAAAQLPADNPFLTQPNVQDALRTLAALRDDPDWFISDVVDDERHQYVDFVLEGGGILGIALAGYVYGLETAGIRFLRLGGTSAGAIVAMLLASLRPRHEAAGAELLGILASKNFYEFVDGDSDARDFTKTLLGRSKTHTGLGAWLRNQLDMASIISGGLQVVDNFRDRQGLHPGRAFRDWLHELLKPHTPTIEALVARREQVPPGGLRQRVADAAGQYGLAAYAPEGLCRVAVVAADITTQTKVVFPEMAPLYWDDWRQVSPAELVRASMSIPFFFEPYRVPKLPGSQPGASGRYLAQWKELGYAGRAVPPEAVFMDGGIMSNFPIDLFHNNERVPEAPTFGVKLGIDRSQPQATNTFLATVGAMFDATRTQYDFDFIQRNPDYHHLVHCLDVDQYNWLDFGMPQAQKLELFAIGVRGAANFLSGFRWEDYKQLRATKAEYVRQSRKMSQEKDENQGRTPAPALPPGLGMDWPCVPPQYLRAAPAAPKVG